MFVSPVTENIPVERIITILTYLLSIIDKNYIDEFEVAFHNIYIDQLEFVT